MLVKDLQTFEKVFVASWIGGLGDNPQVWEKLIESNEVFFELLLGRRQLRFFFGVASCQQIENKSVRWVVAEATSQGSTFLPRDFALAGSVEELEGILEGLKSYSKKTLNSDAYRQVDLQ